MDTAHTSGAAPDALIAVPMAAPPPDRVNVVTAGDALVGKSCLVKRLCEGRFVSRHVPTIGVDYGVKVVDVGTQRVRANFFDLSGVDAHLEVRNEFYRDAHGVSDGGRRRRSYVRAASQSRTVRARGIATSRRDRVTRHRRDAT